MTSVDYEHGKPYEVDGALQIWPADRAQLAVQTMVLRENGYRVGEGVIFYAATRQRVRVPLDRDVIEETEAAIRDAQVLAEAGRIPAPLDDSPKCPGCSLNSIYLPGETTTLRNAADEDTERLALFEEMVVPRKPALLETRETALAIDAGSCWRLTSASPEFGAALARAQEDGIGIRRIEGFGWIAVNPLWLLPATLRGLDASTGATVRGPADWPGFAAKDRTRLQGLAAEARKTATRWHASRADEKAARAAKLASYAKRLGSVLEITDYLKALCTRDAELGRSSSWADAEMQETLARCITVHEAAFYLDAIVTEFEWAKEHSQ